MTRARSGILTPKPARSVKGAYAVVDFELDTRTHRFLRDHLVDGRPLLSTVMGIETMACAVQSLHEGAVITEIADVRVGPPFFLVRKGTGDVDVTVPAGSPARCELRSGSHTDAPQVHFSGEVSLSEAVPPMVAARPAPADGTTHVDAAAVYSVFFHGGSFRVIESAWFGDGVLVGRLASGLPSIVEPPRASILAPLLIELCLQTAGLWELAVLGRMMIPTGIDRVVRLTDAHSTTPGLLAVVSPRMNGSGGYVFDAEVVDEDGAVHLIVQGYRTTEFAHPHDLAAAARLRSALGAG